MNRLNNLITSPIFTSKIASIIKDTKSNRQWQAMIDHAEPFVNKATRGFQKLFNEQEAQILAQLENHKAFTDEIDWSEWEVKFQEFDQLLLPSVFASWGPEILNQIIIGIDFNADNQLIHEFIQDHSYRMAVNVNETTKKKIQDIFDTAVDNGESVPQIMKRIRAEFADIGKVRANMIARSEIMRAHNASSEMAYIQSGVVEFKQWYTARDERRCPFCAEMHGKTMAVGGEYFKQGDRFEVTDSEGKRHVMKLDYSDIKYPPLHIRCRCVLLPIVFENGKMYVILFGKWFRVK